MHLVRVAYPLFHAIPHCPDSLAILAVQHFRVALQQRVCLLPLPHGAARHGDVFQLSMSQPGLNFDIGGAFLAEPLVPVPSSLPHAPYKHFPSKQAAGGALQQAIALFIGGCDPLGRLVRDLVKEIPG